ncbi:MAG: ATP-binding protein [Treponema sp.]|nr:ATP-binding protein [Treponema sp.]
MRRRFRGTMNSSINYTKDEPYSICFYLCNIFEDKSNMKILTENYSAIYLFYNCVKKLDKLERLETVLQREIGKLEKQNILKPLSQPTNELMKFEDYNIPFRYEQDKKIERLMCHCENSDEKLIDLFRVLGTSENTLFTSIINSVVLRNDKECSLTKEIKLSKKMSNAVFDVSKTRFLIDNLKLSEEEALYLLIQCRFTVNNTLQAIMRDYEEDVKNCMPDFLRISQKDFKYMLRSDQKLKSFGFIDNSGDYDSALNDCIEAQSLEPYFSDVLRPLDCSNSYTLDSFNVKKDSLEICTDLLKGKNPVSILFYGKPGSGKTELAKALCRDIGKNVYIFKNEAEENDNILGRLVCLLSMEREDSILIVDEADTLLKTLDYSFFGKSPSKSKGTVNKMLENNMDKVIYIINHTGQIDESTMRRFTFSIKFEAMSSTQLHSIAKTKIDPLELNDSTKENILEMFNKYHLTGQSVDNIVKTIEGMECKDDEVLLRKVQTVMKENSLLLNGKKKMRDTVKTEYDPHVINASMNPLQIIEMVQNAVKFAETNKGTENGIRMLFYGLSGTGKTEFARYISKQLGKPIVLKRTSDIMSPYVGENEQNIRDAFEEAEKTDSILLFDEADSFIYNRNQAQRSWERNVVNEFLTQMEEFTGILICTTNLREILDPAMQRRFHILVEFKPMKFDGIKILLERYFPAYHISNREIEELEDMESVTPGDFGALSSRIRFMNQDDVNTEYILNELTKMQGEKKKQWEDDVCESGTKKAIGFTA